MSNNLPKALSLCLLICCMLLISASFVLATPTINITSPNNSVNINQDSNIIINYNISNINQALYNYTCSVFSTKAGSYLPLDNCFYNTTLVMANQGNNNVSIKVSETNSSGNITGVVSGNVTFFVDSISPIINIVFPTSNAYYNYNISYLNFTYNETNPSLFWLNNGSLNITNTTYNQIPTNFNLNIGSNTWTMYINDTLNNTSSSSVTFTYDPINPVLNNLWNETLENSVKLNFKTSEAVIVSVRYGINATSLNLTSNTTSYEDEYHVHLNDILNNTLYYYNVTICDRAFNCVRYGTYNISVNFTAPISTTTPSCYTDAVCGEYGACSAVGLQTRICNKILINCSYSTPPILTRTCNYSLAQQNILTTTPPANNLTNTTDKSFFSDWGGISDGWKTAILIISIIVIIIVAVLLFLKFRNPDTGDISPQQYDQPYVPPYDQFQNQPNQYPNRPLNNRRNQNQPSYSDNPDDYLPDNA